MAAACFGRLCCSCTLKISSASDDEPWDVVAASSGSWWDPTGATLYDKVIVSLVTPLQDESMVVEVVGGGCSSNSSFTFVKGKRGRTILLMHKRSNNCADIRFTVGKDDKEATTTLPLPGDEWTTATVHGLELRMRAEAAETMHATTEQYLALGLQRHDIPIPIQHQDNDAGGEQAVVTYKRRDGNRRMLLWLPGRNDVFYHPHVLPRLLEAGYDVFTICHRRNGVAQENASKRAKQLTSHVDDFRRYLYEWDEAMDFALAQHPYESVALYGHSTGGLEASLFLREARERARVDKVVLNSPFLDWGEGGLAETILDDMGSAFKVISLLKGSDRADVFAMQVPSGPGRYGTSILSQYQRDAPLNRYGNVVDNLVTAGWSRAVTRMQKEMAAKPPSEVPTMLLHTPSDQVLDGEELGALAAAFSSRAEAVEVRDCRHDMLLNFWPEKNEEVLGIMLEFLGRGA